MLHTRTRTHTLTLSLTGLVPHHGLYPSMHCVGPGPGMAQSLGQMSCCRCKEETVYLCVCVCVRWVCVQKSVTGKDSYATALQFERQFERPYVNLVMSQHNYFN